MICLKKRSLLANKTVIPVNCFPDKFDGIPFVNT